MAKSGTDEALILVVLFFGGLDKLAIEVATKTCADDDVNGIYA